jgi:Histidine phosphatase superfamily (branch 2)
MSESETFQEIRRLRLKFVQVLTRHGLRVPGTQMLGGGHGNMFWNCDYRLAASGQYAVRSMLTQNMDTAGNEVSGSKGRAYVKRFLQHDVLKTPGTCIRYSLTSQGVEQMHELGRQYRRRYIDHLGLLPQSSDFDHERVWVRSTDIGRTVLSAQSFLLGMFPQQSDEDGAGVVPIHVADRRVENMYPRYSVCPRFKQLREAAKKTSAGVALERANEPLIAMLRAAFDVDDGERFPRTSWQGLANTMISIIAHQPTHLCVGEYARTLPCKLVDESESVLPTAVTVDMVDKVVAAAGADMELKFGTAELCRLAIGPFVGELRDNIAQVVRRRGAHRSRKFVLYSGHDNTLAPMLASLGISAGELPPMGSHVAMEVYVDDATDEHWIRVLYNNKVMPLAKAVKDAGIANYDNDVSLPSGGVIRFEHFDQLASRVIPDDYELECQKQ